MAKKHAAPRILLRREKDPSQLGVREPTQLGGTVGNYLPPGAQYEFKPVSVFAQYRFLSGVFAALVLGILVYWIVFTQHHRHVAPVRPAVPSPPADEPVYVEPLAPRSTG